MEDTMELCWVCQCNDIEKPIDLVYLDQPQISKLTSICKEVIPSEKDIPLCRGCFYKLDWVHDFVALLRSNISQNLPKNSKGKSSEPESGDPRQCTICGKFFSSRSNAFRHIREHNGQRYACPFPSCDKFFTQRSSIKAHVESHKGAKLFTCPTCGKNFSQKKNMLLHQNIHTGDLPFECEYCSRKFRQKVQLVRHFVTHRKPMKEKRFQCTVCRKLFSTKQSLDRHNKMHERSSEDGVIATALKTEDNSI